MPITSILLTGVGRYQACHNVYTHELQPHNLGRFCKVRGLHGHEVCPIWEYRNPPKLCNIEDPSAQVLLQYKRLALS